VQDLIGSGDVTDQISSLEISGKSFSQQTVNVESRRERRENRTSGGSNAQSKLEGVKTGAIARRGNVEFTEKPQAVEGEATQNNRRTPMALSAVIKPEQARLVYAYEKWLKKDPNLSGKLIIRFTILSNGSVSTVEIVSSTTNNAEFDSTICRYIKRWEFPPIPENSGSVTVVYPFVFTGVRS
jgi:TonB family protein